MKYISTRGNSRKLNFADVAINALADDGGLYIPESFPEFSSQEIANMAGLSYSELCFKIMQPFVADSIPDDDLKEIINKSYANFRHSAIAPLKQIGEHEFILELFHGPTLAFKDFALQFLGQIFDYILKKRGEKITVVAATSGDTGSAAIDGCRGSEFVNMFVLHPKGRISEVQRKQMTSVIENNIHNLAVEGDFDFCQHAIKSIFSDKNFLKNKTKLVAVNSINWCRIMAQIVYYFYAALNLGAPARKMIFSVPTGNFGNIFAGFIAKKMGLPIDKLIIATNKNDILHKFMEGNIYKKGELYKTLSPSMDIQVSSNFERLVFEILQNDGKKVAGVMNDFNATGVSLDNYHYNEIKKMFASYVSDDEAICKTIKQVYEQCGEVIDPHTATGIRAAREIVKNSDDLVITLATAHPAKFPDAIKAAGLKAADLPEYLSDLGDREEKYEVIDADIEKIKEYIEDKG